MSEALQMPSDMKSKVLAIDYGTKRIGLALSDDLRMLARAIGVIDRQGDALGKILQLIEKEKVDTVIIGLPRNLDATDSMMTTEVRGFAERLFNRLDALDIAHFFHDERLTSIIAAGNILQQGLPRHKRQEKYRHDEEAARIMLQEYLDSNT